MHAFIFGIGVFFVARRSEVIAYIEYSYTPSSALDVAGEISRMDRVPGSGLLGTHHRCHEYQPFCARKKAKKSYINTDGITDNAFHVLTVLPGSENK
jgi:hypothetical protein